MSDLLETRGTAVDRLCAIIGLNALLHGLVFTTSVKRLNRSYCCVHLSPSDSHHFQDVTKANSAVGLCYAAWDVTIMDSK
jgi:hypothetical protein